MQLDVDLQEKVIHGTRKNPITAIHFESGPDTDYPDNFFVKRHWHSQVEMILIRKGEYFLELNLENYVLGEGDICIFNSEELHELTGEKGCTAHDVLLFDPCILEFSYPDEWQEQKIRPFLNHSCVFQNLLYPQDQGYGEIRELFEHFFAAGLEKKENWYVRCKLLLLELFASLSEKGFLLPDTMQSRAEMLRISRYKTVVSYIEEHYGEPVSLQQMADKVSCNSQYLCRFFKEIAGITPVRYLILYRIERASFFLANTTRPVLEIAMDCGFENVSYFIRKFKEIRGCTPKEYRRRSGVV